MYCYVVVSLLNYFCSISVQRQGLSNYRSREVAYNIIRKMICAMIPCSLFFPFRNGFILGSGISINSPCLKRVLDQNFPSDLIAAS